MSEPVDRGILSSVPGQFLGGRGHSLPDAATAQVDRITSTIHADHVGLVRVTFERVENRHHKSYYWSWRAIHAERVEQQP